MPTRAVLSVTLLACLVGGGVCAADAGQGWPGLAGPAGTFTPAPSPTALVDDLGQARKAWESAFRDLGRAKGESSFYRGPAGFTAAAMAKNGSHPGSWSAPVIGHGLVFAASWRPVGPTVDVQGSAIRLDAEDIVVALDAATGATRWLVAEPGGLLRAGGKRQGFHGGPVLAGGVVYSLGSTGRIAAYDALTGERRWQSDVHPQRAAMQKERETMLAGLAEGRLSYRTDIDLCASLAVIGGVLIVPVAGGGDLIGVDLRTGALRWAARDVSARWATPATWRHADREYLLAANERGELRLIDPTDGRELWKLAGLGPMWPTLTPGRTHVLVNGVAGSGSTRGTRVAGRYVAVRLSPERGEITWSAPTDHGFPVWMDAGARQRVLYRDGRFLITSALLERSAMLPREEAAAAGDAKVVTPAYVLDEATGAVVAAERTAEQDYDARINGLVYWIGDRLLVRGDSFHGCDHGGRHPWKQWRIAGGRIERVQGTMDLADFTTGYEVALEVPLVDGRMFERLENGGIACYDLRRP